jgi:hypothetical protein
MERPAIPNVCMLFPRSPLSATAASSSASDENALPAPALSDSDAIALPSKNSSKLFFSVIEANVSGAVVVYIGL